MKLADSIRYYESHSQAASANARALALAGLALVWIFKIDLGKGHFSVPAGLVLPATMIVVSLVVDFAQYVWAALAWGFFNRKMERKFSNRGDQEFEAPRWINWPTLGCFWCKIVALSVAYGFILLYLGRMI